MAKKDWLTGIWSNFRPAINLYNEEPDSVARFNGNRPEETYLLHLGQLGLVKDRLRWFNKKGWNKFVFYHNNYDDISDDSSPGSEYIYSPRYTDGHDKLIGKMKVKSWPSVYGGKARINVKNGKFKLWSSKCIGTWDGEAIPELIIKGKLLDSVNLEPISVDSNGEDFKPEKLIPWTDCTNLRFL